MTVFTLLDLWYMQGIYAIYSVAQRLQQKRGRGDKVVVKQ